MAKKNMWYVYVLLSKIDNKKYIGSTNDIERRLKEHNEGKTPSTKNRRPLILVYQEYYNEESQARFREKFLKTHKGYNELKKFINKRAVV